MTGFRPPVIRTGDIVTVDEGRYCYGLGRLTLEVIEVGARERHTDGLWLNLRGVELRPSDGVRLRQRRVLVRLDAVRIRPGRLSRARRAGPLPPAPHLAARPAWTCTGCGAPWPCPVRRARLLTEYADSRLTLLVYLAGYLLDAAADLRHLPADELYARFLGWVT
ncbi:hypothetical protein V6U90_03530 [Micromonospora sp. CPCC 206060]|uniref:hypothetical protein n=1 Tax=Micromonospora sp. CPCC 206060 TaxID=3122406 RepID=UPI002FF3EC68